MEQRRPTKVGKPGVDWGGMKVAWGEEEVGGSGSGVFLFSGYTD